ncbi:MAG: hypothetical protein U0531_15780 [Dehalococcoidia bacterium]
MATRVALVWKRSSAAHVGEPIARTSACHSVSSKQAMVTQRPRPFGSAP